MPVRLPDHPALISAISDTFGSAESLACKTGLCPDATKVRDQRRHRLERRRIKIALAALELDRLPIFLAYRHPAGCGTSPVTRPVPGHCFLTTMRANLRWPVCDPRRFS